MSIILEKTFANVAELKTCSQADMSKYSILIIDALSYLEINETIEIANNLYVASAGLIEEKPLLNAYVKLIQTFSTLLNEEFEKAQVTLEETYNLFSNLNETIGLSVCKGVKGTIYRIIGNYDLALEFLLESQPELKGNPLLQIRLMACLNDIGGIYLDLNQIPEAHSIFKEMELLTSKNDSFYWTIYATQGLGKVELANQNFKKAEDYFFKALQFSEINNCKKSICNSLNALANYFFILKDYEKAIKYNTQSLILREELNLISGAITNCISIGTIYYKQEQYDLAIEILNKGYRLANSIQVKKKIYQIHLLLSEIYEAKNDLQKTLYHYKLYHEIQFLLEAEDNKRKISNAKIIFQSEQNKKENILIKKQKELLEAEKEKTEFLLYNILPKEIAKELQENGTSAAKLIEFTTIMFTDFKGFTKISEKLSPAELVNEIDTCFKTFDKIITKHNIEKIKTIGDSYMCAGGIPTPNKTHAIDVVNAALEIQQYMQEHSQERKKQKKEIFEIRIGIHTGPVVAGIVGLKKFAYDIWGDTVNLASRMESSGEEGEVNISENTYLLIKDKFKCIHRGKINAKNKGDIDMYFVQAPETIL